MATTRIATTKAGMTYLVSFLDFQSNKAVLFGEVVSRKGLSTKHAGTKSFALDSVKVETVELNDALVAKLWAQADREVEAGRVPGYVSKSVAAEQRAVAKAVRREASSALDAFYAGNPDPFFSLLARVVPGGAPPRKAGAK